MNVRNLLLRTIEWMMAAFKNTLCVYGDDNDDVDTFKLKDERLKGNTHGVYVNDDDIKVKGERLEVKGDRFGEIVSSSPLALRVLPLTQGGECEQREKRRIAINTH